MEKELVKIFVDATYSEAPMRNYPTNKIVYNHFDRICSIDLADFIDYKTSIHKGF